MSSQPSGQPADGSNSPPGHDVFPLLSSLRLPSSRPGAVKDVTLYILKLLDLDDKLRLQLMSPAWRASLRDPSLWRDVDLSAVVKRLPMHHLRRTEAYEKFVRAVQAVSSLSAGGMRSLCLPFYALSDLVLATVNANAELKQLQLMSADEELVRHVLEVGPALKLLSVSDLSATLDSSEAAQQLAAALSGQGAYASLRVEKLDVTSLAYNGDRAALLRSLGSHRSLRGICLGPQPQPDHAMAIDLACAAARAGAVKFEFKFANATDIEEFSGEMMRLLRDFPVRELGFCDGVGFFSSEFLEAVRDSRMIQRLATSGMTESLDADFFQALTGHPTLLELELQGTNLDDDDVASSSLYGLLSTPSALMRLSLIDTTVRQHHLRNILRSLESPHACLQRLELSAPEDPYDGFPATPRFVARVIGSAALRCTSLRELVIEDCSPVTEDALRHLNALLAVKKGEAEAERKQRQRGGRKEVGGVHRTKQRARRTAGHSRGSVATCKCGARYI